MHIDSNLDKINIYEISLANGAMDVCQVAWTIIFTLYANLNICPLPPDTLLHNDPTILTWHNHPMLIGERVHWGTF